MKATGENQVTSPSTEPTVHATIPTTSPSAIPTIPSTSIPDSDVSTANSSNSDWLLYTLLGIGCIIFVAGIVLLVTKRKAKHS